VAFTGSSSTPRLPGAYSETPLQRLASLILRLDAGPSYTINFTNGCQQRLHQDTAVFHPAPRNYLVGASIAWDIRPDSEPLTY